MISATGNIYGCTWFEIGHVHPCAPVTVTAEFNVHCFPHSACCLTNKPSRRKKIISQVLLCKLCCSLYFQKSVVAQTRKQTLVEFSKKWTGVTNAPANNNR